MLVSITIPCLLYIKNYYDCFIIVYLDYKKINKIKLFFYYFLRKICIIDDFFENSITPLL